MWLLSCPDGQADIGMLYFQTLLVFCLGIFVRVTFIDADVFSQYLLNRFNLPLSPKTTFFLVDVWLYFLLQ